MCKEQIVFFATGWGSQYGGINSFNTDICSALAKVLNESYQVVCVVPKDATSEIEAANNAGIKLIHVDTYDSSGILEISCLPDVFEILETLDYGNVSWWIGHNIKTGSVAISACKQSKKGRTALIHHMDYSAYAALKPGSTQKKILQQRRFLSNADIVFAVGPKLTRSAQNKTQGLSCPKVIEIIPGLASISGIPSPNGFSAITFGRLSPDTDRLKQISLAVAAFARAISIPHQEFPPDPFIKLIGLSLDTDSEFVKDLRILGQKEASRAVQIHPWPYINDRKMLFEEIQRHTVCMMLSVHEGFGLSGWEAIAAEVPLIVSYNSGLYETIDNILAGTGTGCLIPVTVKGALEGQPYQPDDVDTVVDALIKVKNDIPRAKRNAKSLKDTLGLLCTWENAARKMATALDLSPSETKPLTVKSHNRIRIQESLKCSKEQVEQMVASAQKYYGF